jgi:4a-hydroxytetrahydrobiopterin dehydratase
MSLLSAEAVTDALRSLPGWSLEGEQLVRTVEFRDFVGAIMFVNHVAEQAEDANHHPDIDIRYNKVKLALVSHDAGGLTDRDVAMARTLSSLLP